MLELDILENFFNNDKLRIEQELKDLKKKENELLIHLKIISNELNKIKEKKDMPLDKTKDIFLGGIKEEIIPCSLCNYLSSSTSGQTQHNKNCFGPIKPCALCGKKFSRKSHQIQHNKRCKNSSSLRGDNYTLPPLKEEEFLPPSKEEKDEDEDEFGEILIYSSKDKL